MHSIYFGAAFGSSSTVHATLSDPSAQSGLLSQNKSLAIHSSLLHCNWPSGQTGSSVFKIEINYTRFGESITIINLR